MGTERCKLANVIMFEERQGTRFLEKKVQLLVHLESSAKTVERINTHLRTTYAVPGDERVRVTREMWEKNPQSVLIETVGKSSSRKFVIQFDDPVSKPKWEEPDF